MLAAPTNIIRKKNRKGESSEEMDTTLALPDSRRSLRRGGLSGPLGN